ncbi:MAG: diphosphomevalonate decarboxylase [Gammaproteobacteria bacterium]|nr:diphosphomevalonate decarboxylase [Gammaproteobacteria bacterium]MYB38213.1 diphosphomevalonate decarboxylase [Gammaproteobacteria bacterium]
MAARGEATAVAHPNVALVKYWGKQAGAGNRPATPSLSVTLSGIATTTRVEAAPADRLWLNGKEAQDPKIAGFLAELRTAFDIPGIAITTGNDFPTGAGLASSASGFAALTTAIDAAFGLGLDRAERSVWARRGSASAARSIFGGFVALVERGGESVAETVADADHWPLAVTVGVASKQVKSVGSTAGMERARATSPFYNAWTTSTHDDFSVALRAVRARDFDALAEVAEHSSMKLHALTLTSRPAIVYWAPATVAALHALAQLRSAGTGVFASIDAGPQVKAFSALDDADDVADALATVPGIERVIRCSIGPAAAVTDAG